MPYPKPKPPRYKLQVQEDENDPRLWHDVRKPDGKNEGAHFGAGGPKNGQTPEPVLMYMPRGEDNSASSQAFLSGEAWPSLKGDGNLVHLSSGGGDLPSDTGGRRLRGGGFAILQCRS